MGFGNILTGISNTVKTAKNAAQAAEDNKLQASWDRIMGFGSAGAARGNELFAPGSLDTAELQDVMARRKAALSGLSAPEFAMARSKAYEGLNTGLATNLRAMRNMQGQTGLRGGAANAGFLALTKQAQGERRGLERDLALQDIGMKQQALDAYEATSGRALGQREKELAGRVGMEMGYAGLGSQLYGDLRSEAIQRAMVDAANAQVARAEAEGASPSKQAVAKNWFGQPLNKRSDWWTENITKNTGGAVKAMETWLPAPGKWW